MEPELFVATFPKLYHMAHKDSWEGIKRHGLLSTTALLDQFETDSVSRAKIEGTLRKTSVRITHPTHGVAVIRDQKPMMSDKKLASALNGSATPEQWYRLLNSKAFFWVLPERLLVLRNAREYRTERQLVLTFDSQKIVEDHLNKIWLCPMNSGACSPFAHPRTPEIFQPLEKYDFDHWSKKRGSKKKGVVEFTLAGDLPEVEKYLLKKQTLEAFE